MNDQRFCEGWRQVRVFFNDFSEAGFRAFHAAVTLPFAQAKPAHPFFVSHYAVGDQDAADTNIQNLPPHFRRADGAHHSIRIRFRNFGDTEQRLQALIPAACWYSDFRDYEVVNDLANDRFCDYASADLTNRRKRARIVANLLFCSTMFYLDNLRNDAHGVGFEASHCNLNSVLNSPYQSVLHMVLNPPMLAGKVAGLIPHPNGVQIRGL